MNKKYKQLRKLVNEMDAEECRQTLRIFLSELVRLREQPEEERRAAEGLVSMYDSLIRYKERPIISWDPDPACERVHVMVGDSFAGSMKQALTGLQRDSSDKLIVLWENYGIGPLPRLGPDEELETRREWFTDHISGSMEIYEDYGEQIRQLRNQIASIPEHADITVWTGNNGNEQTGLRLAVYLLQGRGSRLYVRNAGTRIETKFRRPGYEFWYHHSGEISADKLADILPEEPEMALTPTERERLAREWEMLAASGSVLRVWRGGRLEEADADYYDAFILEKLDELMSGREAGSFLHTARVVGEVIGHADQFIGDSYIEYRIRQLIYDGILEIKGVPAAMRYYKIRRRRDERGTGGRQLELINWRQSIRREGTERIQSIVHIALVVNDYDEAIEFYTQKLNFTLIEDTYQPEQDKRWVVVAPPGSAGTTLLLARASKPEQEAFIGNQAGGRVFLFLNTDDFWRDYQAMVSKGIEFVREPQQQSYGMVAVFKDLYGNLWDLLELNEDHPISQRIR